MKDRTPSEKSGILIVDDEFIVAADLESRLRNFGYGICGIADSAEKAFELAEKRKPDLVLMDIVIKGDMDGIDAAQILQEKYGVPVLFLTAYADTERIERAKTACPLGYLIKPYHDNELKVAIEMALYAACTDAQRRKAEEALRKSEERHSAILSAMPDLMFIVDRDFRFVDCQTNAPELLIMPPERFIGRRIDEVLPSSLAERTRINLEKTLAEKTTQTYHYRIEIKGELQDYEVRTAASGCDQVLFIVRDITEKKKTEAALLENKNLLNVIADNYPNSIVSIIEEDYSISYISGQELKKRSLDSARYTGLRVDRVFPNQADLVLSNIEKTFKGEEQAFEMVIEQDLYLTQTVPLTSPDGAVSRILAVAENITERKQAENRLKESEETVRRKLEAVLEPEGDIGLLSLSDILNAERVQSLMDELYKLIGVGIGILDLQGTVLVEAGWQDVCTRFHRVNPETRRFCIESDLELSTGVEPGKFKIYKCKNNMWDMATPIVVGGRHVGNIFLGQFFFEDEEPDREFFKRQAVKYGFDVKDYLAAIDKTPRWSRDTVNTVMTFYSKFAQMLSTMSYSRLKLARTLSEKNRLLGRLTESENKYRTIFENAPLGVFRSTSEGRFMEVNPAFAKMFGYESPQDILAEANETGKQGNVCGVSGFSELVKTMSEDSVAKHVNRYRRRDCSEFIANIYIKSTADESGKRLYLDGVVEDVTERKELEAALKEREAAYRKAYNDALNFLSEVKRREREISGLLKSSRAVLTSKDFKTAARAVYETCKELTGANSGYVALLSDNGEENDLLFLDSGGRPCSVDPSLPMPIRGLRAESYKTGKAVYDNDFMNSRWMEFMPQGHLQLDNVLFSPLNIDNKTAGIIGLANKDGDFTDNDAKIAEAFGEIAAIALQNSRLLEEIEASEYRFKQLFNNMSSGAAVYSPADDGRHLILTDINDVGNQIAVLGSRDMIGRSVNDLFPFVHAGDLLDVFYRVNSTGTPESYCFKRYSGEDISFWIDCFFYKLPTDEIVVVFNDATDRKKAERKRYNLEIQLRQALKMEAVGTLAGGIAHDFNNLLQGINGYCQILMLDKTNTSPEYSSLKAILDSGNRAKELVRQLLLFSRKAETQRRYIELNDEIERAQRILGRTIPKMVDIELRLGGRLWTVLADPVQIEQIILNLGANAADAMPDGGKLQIETENVTIDENYSENMIGLESGRYIRLSVTDTGEGMKKEILDKIFEPFFTTKEIGKGTGLGLASVYGIVKSHGGYITCSSEVGRGTKFKIYLPAVDRPGDNAAAALESNPLSGGTETLLIVDDEKPIREFATRVLEKFGYTVLTASSGEEALDIYAQESGMIDLVIMDIGMPGMGGYKCMMEVLGIDPSARIVIASGYSKNTLPGDPLKAGARGYIGKPYQLEDLVNTIRYVLDAGLPDETASRIGR